MGKVFENLLKRPLSQKRVQIYLQDDLMQNQVVKVMVPEQLGPQLRKVTLHLFICEIFNQYDSGERCGPWASCLWGSNSKGVNILKRNLLQNQLTYFIQHLG
jgi:hypothetical protein